MKVSLWGGIGLCCLLSLNIFLGCRRETPSNFDRNLPPETVVTGAPAESSAAFYQVHLKWYGVDEDGVVDYYEYAVTDSNKTPGEDEPGFSGFFKTTRTDSVFFLPADNPQTLGHRFYVRAVDNEGKNDPTPAWVYFVASDYNAPYVTYLSAKATWTDRKGDTRTRAITSNSPSVPTDTIGVGSTVSFSWTGGDDDPNGYVVGFEYRLSTENDYSGGSLADTSLTYSFMPVTGAGLSAYFTGVGAIVVRAIDDAGAKTDPTFYPDAVRSFVVNFSPKAWIVDPTSAGNPKGRFFVERENGTTRPSGTVLADGNRTIRFKFTGVDDDRDLHLDPTSPSGVIGFEYRRLKNGNGLAYQPVPGTNSYPILSDYNDGFAHTSADWTYLIRAVDELGRKGKPDTLEFGVNYSPYWDYVKYVAPDSSLQTLWNPAGPAGGQVDTVTVDLAKNPDGTYPSLTVEFFARDDHSFPDKDPKDFNPVIEQELGVVKDYQVLLNSARGGFDSAPTDSLGRPIPEPDTRTYPISVQGGAGLRNGLNTLQLVARDLSGRLTVLVLVFRVNLL